MTGRADIRKNPVRGLVCPNAEKSISLALQGGGAHGAFTWGVLDYLLEDGRLMIEAITGASAGSMNAVVLFEGWLEGGRDGAREQLRKFWKRVSLDGVLSPVQRTLFDRMLSYWSMNGSSNLWFDAWSRVASPYDLNPLDINPLRDALNSLINFERVRACKDAKLFIAATSVWSGKIRVFNGPELTVDHVLASACLPMLFKAVEIDGEPYWDGGYTGNPALFPLFYETQTDDILLVQINPIERRSTPRSVQEIQNRLTEITFNANLLQQFRAIEFVTRLIDEGKLSADDYKRVFMHRIHGGEKLDEFTAASRLSAQWSFFKELKNLGRNAARTWLRENYQFIGKKGTLDLRNAYT
ncbi:patatin-like phospholipase family protein [Microvirga lotononidis]|uniref:Putative esterase of the alpha-beta hydrolase superfamily n=1 Tax=Microvirga lotononidis TaxID=864069 RepID=I4YVA2_9HYPH|nr:patatin-like phospholipase family protein [Microvirga lotononidis]EIM27894.1 putative esterase of the alpha-beta hydrolase superfamily [Microvirga lotononidis]WQO27979.1 patatin-like phospholipase family protein [Microvirga lotononidis]